MGRSRQLPQLQLALVISGALSSAALATSDSAGSPWTAANVAITNVRELDKYGGGPVFSPDGQRVLYEKDGSVWLMNPDGSAKREVVQHARRPAWSPDGKKFAFIDSGPDRVTWGNHAEVSVFDLELDKTLRLKSVLQVAHNKSLAWSKNGAKLVLMLGSRPYKVLDLDTLGWSEGPDRAGVEWLEENTSLPIHPNFQLVTDRPGFGGGHRPRGGIWAVNRKGFFQALLLPGPWEEPTLSPDFSRVVFTKVGMDGGILVANLNRLGRRRDTRYLVAPGSSN